MKKFVNDDVVITRFAIVSGKSSIRTVEVVKAEEFRRRHPMDGRWSKGQWEYGRAPGKAGGRFGRGAKTRIGWQTVSPPDGDAA